MVTIFFINKDTVMAMTFGKLGQEEHVLVLVTNSKSQYVNLQYLIDKFKNHSKFDRWITSDQNFKENCGFFQGPGDYR